MNNISDSNDFANRCAKQGFTIIRFGTSPSDNVDREKNGIKDFKDEVKKQSRRKKEHLEKEVIIEQISDEKNIVGINNVEEKAAESSITEVITIDSSNMKEVVSPKRKIQIIKK